MQLTWTNLKGFVSAARDRLLGADELTMALEGQVAEATAAALKGREDLQFAAVQMSAWAAQCEGLQRQNERLQARVVELEMQRGWAPQQTKRSASSPVPLSPRPTRGGGSTPREALHRGVSPGLSPRASPEPAGSEGGEELQEGGDFGRGGRNGEGSAGPSSLHRRSPSRVSMHQRCESGTPPPFGGEWEEGEADTREAEVARDGERRMQLHRQMEEAARMHQELVARRARHAEQMARLQASVRG
jgi:hypothetical protein